MTNARKILIPFAIREGILVHVSAVAGGNACECTCPVCEEDVVAKKGAIRSHHFAHAAKSSSCSDETVLHKLGKRILRERIEAALAGKKPIVIKWPCPKCGGEHEANLLGKAVAVQEEVTIGSARADLGLLNIGGSPYIAVEVVVTHEPEFMAREAYRANRVTCVEFFLKSGEDLVRVRNETPLVASAVSYCMAPKCRCGGRLFPRDICILDIPCWKCGRTMKASYGYFGYGPEPPSSFKSEEIAYARGKGVRLERRHSGVVNRWYLMNVCPHCDRPWGDHYAGTLWQDFGKHPFETVLLACEECGVLQRAAPKANVNSS